MTTAALGTGVGPMLRGWREQRRISQLELALRADSSARHISFIETGRSRPSEEMILRLAEHLDVPVRERNSLLLAAGYAPHYAQTPLDDPSMSALREGMERLLRAYDPYPAVMVDATYTVLAANRGMGMLLDGVAPHLLTPPVNAMRLTLHPEGLAPRIRNLPEWRGHLLEQMERQIALLRNDALRELYEEVAAHPVCFVRPEPPVHPVHPVHPVQPVQPVPSASASASADAEGSGDASVHPAIPFALPLRIEHAGTVLSFISTIATFNTPMDVTVSELAIETFLPADPETAKYLQSLMP
ncbi:helix-turn-helix domain-containing protein [Streptomyces sp. NPDC006691]|uniref:helix-turn-helix domain-containing protein n=1 Tax=Streptomyces sp. NPDC006691 TaxID=3364757 RepID=UPI0036BE6F1F